MRSRSDSITWQGWARKWGDWTTWFRTTDVPLEPLERSVDLPTLSTEGRGQNIRTQRELLMRDQPSTHVE